MFSKYHTRLRVAIATIVLVPAVLISCGNDAGVTSTALRTTLPSWIESVRPLPDSAATANTVIEVAHRVVDPDHFIRVIVDGIDVTADTTEETAGTTIYRPLEPGPHTATVERTLLPGQGEEFVVLDSFTWTFETP